MSFVRNIVKGSENSIRQAQVTNRMFFQKAEYDRPMHVRAKGDTIWFGAALAVGAGSIAYTIYNFTRFVFKKQ